MCLTVCTGQELADRKIDIKRGGKMHFERIKNSMHSLYKQALELYQISFPFHEQRESASQEAILSNDLYHFDLIYDGESFVGLVLYWERSDYIYIEHFCIQPELRNRQYGRRALSLLQEKGKIMILEIDPPIDAISMRRKGFYERCGFVENPYPHIHPPYHKGNTGHELVIMSNPRLILQSEYDSFNSFLKGIIMNSVFA